MGYVPFFGDSLWFGKMFDEITGGINEINKFLANQSSDKVGTLIQIPAKTMLFIHDPSFVEKLLKFVPSHLDRDTDFEFFGKNGIGHTSILDMKSDQNYDRIRA